MTIYTRTRSHGLRGSSATTPVRRRLACGRVYSLSGAGIDELANDTYDMDEDDAEWLGAYNAKVGPQKQMSEDIFENIITQLELAYSETPVRALLRHCGGDACAI